MASRPAVLHLRFLPRGPVADRPLPAPDSLRRFCSDFSPAWTLESQGAFLDIAGCGRLWGHGPDGPGHLCRQARRAFGPVWGGAGPTLLTARLASLFAWNGSAAPAVLTVTSGSAPAFLAPFPVSTLDSGGSSSARLRALGVRTLGDLQTLPAALLRGVFGPEGARLQAMALARDGGLLRRPEQPVSGIFSVAEARCDRPLVSRVGLAALREGLAMRALAFCPQGPRGHEFWRLVAILPEGRRHVRIASKSAGSLLEWRSLLQHLQSKLDLRRRGILGLALQAGPACSGEVLQGRIFSAGDAQENLSSALALINRRHPGRLGAASEKLLARWGVRWVEVPDRDRLAGVDAGDPGK